jgi:hypothetical protein
MVIDMFVGDEIDMERTKKVAHLCGSDHRTITARTAVSDNLEASGNWPFWLFRIKH